MQESATRRPKGPMLDVLVGEIRRTAPSLQCKRYKGRALFFDGADVLAVVAHSDGVELLFFDDIVCPIADGDEWRSGIVLTGIDTRTLSSLRALVRKLQLAGMERRQLFVPTRRRLRKS
ncbi:MAG: hypothetical protein V4617_18655 [Gemmatimonadota bacterium]